MFEAGSKMEKMEKQRRVPGQRGEGKAAEGHRCGKPRGSGSGCQDEAERLEVRL